MSAVLGGRSVAQADPVPSRYVTLHREDHLLADHRLDAAVIADVPDRIGGEPVILPVRGSGDGDGEAWLQVTFRGRDGWLPASVTSPTTPPLLMARSAARLDRLLDLAGPDSGGVISTLQGWVLWHRRDQDVHRLASNAKLFTVAASLARFGSAVSGLVRRLLPPSDNRLAQILSDRLGGGSAVVGAQRAVAFARGLGVEVALADGSGLSYADRGSADGVARFLVALADEPFFDTLYHALPETGRDGTLVDRLRRSVARGRCSAKTGSLAVTSNLSGYCRTMSGHLLVFSLLMDHHSIPDSRTLQDMIVDELVRHD